MQYKSSYPGHIAYSHVEPRVQRQNLVLILCLSLFDEPSVKETSTPGL